MLGRRSADPRRGALDRRRLDRSIKLLALFAFAAAVQAAESLPALHAAREGVTASGVSSGGYMAVQFHVAHSGSVAGVGVIAGGPYYCAQGSVFTALYNCMTPGAWTRVPSAAFLQTEAGLLVKSGRIDATTHLAAARAWLFSGRNDRTVFPQVVEALRDFYTAYKASVVLVADKPAGHGMVTEHAGNACGTTEAPYLVHCEYDAAGELLMFLYGKLAPPAAKESGALLRFDQQRFAEGDAKAISLDETGFLYMPRRCKSERCRVHVVFHGCQQGASAVGERFVREAGYNRWADANGLLVLYPQAIKRYSPFVFNPRGCWDWWGYTGALYHTKSGPQIRAVKAMLDRLSAD